MTYKYFADERIVFFKGSQETVEKLREKLMVLLDEDPDFKNKNCCGDFLVVEPQTETSPGVFGRGFREIKEILEDVQP